LSFRCTKAAILWSEFTGPHQVLAYAYISKLDYYGACLYEQT